MATNTDFEINVNELISNVFGGDRERNDLASGILNEAGNTIRLNYYVHHGSLHEVSEGNKIPQGEQWDAGVHARGAGSNITFNISMPNGSGWAVMGATPSNKQNYFKISHSATGYDSAKDAYKAADKTSKHYSDNGIYDETHNGYRLVVSITGESPAALSVVVEAP